MNKVEAIPQPQPSTQAEWDQGKARIQGGIESAKETVAEVVGLVTKPISTTAAGVQTPGVQTPGVQTPGVQTVPVDTLPDEKHEGPLQALVKGVGNLLESTAEKVGLVPTDAEKHVQAVPKPEPSTQAEWDQGKERIRGGIESAKDVVRGGIESTKDVVRGGIESTKDVVVSTKNVVEEAVGLKGTPAGKSTVVTQGLPDQHHEGPLQALTNQLGTVVTSVSSSIDIHGQPQDEKEVERLKHLHELKAEGVETGVSVAPTITTRSTLDSAADNVKSGVQSLKDTGAHAIHKAENSSRADKMTAYPTPSSEDVIGSAPDQI